MVDAHTQEIINPFAGKRMFECDKKKQAYSLENYKFLEIGKKGMRHRTGPSDEANPGSTVVYQIILLKDSTIALSSKHLLGRPSTHRNSNEVDEVEVTNN